MNRDSGSCPRSSVGRGFFSEEVMNLICWPTDVCFRVRNMRDDIGILTEMRKQDEAEIDRLRAEVERLTAELTVKCLKCPRPGVKLTYQNKK